MITIELGGQAVTVPSVHTSERHYAEYTSAELVSLGVRTRNTLHKATGRRAVTMQAQLYVVERELMRRGVVATYSEKAREVSEVSAAVLLGEWI